MQPCRDFEKMKHLFDWLKCKESWRNKLMVKRQECYAEKTGEGKVEEGKAKKYMAKQSGDRRGKRLSLEREGRE